MPDIRVRDATTWQAAADSEARRANELRVQGLATDITFYCDTREQAARVDEYMRERWREVEYSTVASQNAHEMDNPRDFDL